MRLRRSSIAALLTAAAWLAALWCAPPPAFAQERREPAKKHKAKQWPDRKQRRDAQSADRDQRSRQRRDGQAARERLRGPRPPDHRGELPFRPAPEDYGPLAQGEKEELIDFARREVPRAYNLLTRLRSRNPDEFRRRLKEFVPRFRHLRRIFAENPELGRAIVRHSENLMTLRRIKRAWEQGARTPEQRRRLRREGRRRIAENLRLEHRVLNRRLREREHNRDRDVADRLERLISGEADLAAEAPELRARLRKLRAAGDSQRRAVLEADLRDVVAEQVDSEIAALRERIESIRENAPEEVDRRLRRWFNIRHDGHKPGRPAAPKRSP